MQKPSRGEGEMRRVYKVDQRQARRDREMSQGQRVREEPSRRDGR